MSLSSVTLVVIVLLIPCHASYAPAATSILGFTAEARTGTTGPLLPIAVLAPPACISTQVTSTPPAVSVAGPGFRYVASSAPSRCCTVLRLIVKITPHLKKCRWGLIAVVAQVENISSYRLYSKMGEVPESDLNMVRMALVLLIISK